MNNRTLRIHPDSRDLVIGPDQDFIMISGNDAAAQAVRVTLQVYKGEWFLDLRHGTDYDRIMGLNPTDEEIDLIIREAIFQEPEIKFVDSLVIRREGRKLYIGFAGRLASGAEISTEVTI